MRFWNFECDPDIFVHRYIDFHEKICLDLQFDRLVFDYRVYQEI